MAMEKLMQYVWQHRLWNRPRFTTADGELVDIIDQGLLNTDAGPDFFNAKIKINDRIWVGNIELHLRSSDWYRHGHDKDSSYDSVILHVVGKTDGNVYRSDGQKIPQIEMPCAPDFRDRYLSLVNNPLSNLACSREITSLDNIYIRDWLHSLSFSRLQRKAERACELARQYDGDWSQVIYILLARGLGFGLNSDAFERLALSVPLKLLRKHADSTESVEGMLFGASGLLEKESGDNDEYVRILKDEYRFLSAKYQLDSVAFPGWKMARMRPQNFPHRRIATLASLVCDGFKVGYKLLSCKNVDEARELFMFDLMGYWSRRYNFQSESSPTCRALSQSSIDTLIINVVIPVLYGYGHVYARDEIVTIALEMLQSLPAENNSIIRLFNSAGIKCEDAFTSQALIELRKNYCDSRKCLYCRIGHKLLAAKVKP